MILESNLTEKEIAYIYALEVIAQGILQSFVVVMRQLIAASIQSK